MQPKLGSDALNWRAPSASCYDHKKSFGIILTRINPHTYRPEAVVVRSRYSYAYVDFVHGRYSRKTLQTVMTLLDAMSIDERLDIYSLNFKQMWYRIWLTTDRRGIYAKKLARFQSAWMRDGSDGGHLRRLILNSTTGNWPGDGIRWEFPKGKKTSTREPSMNCAIREFKEEAGVAKRDYQILPEFKRCMRFTHMGTRYTNIYYTAIVRRPLELKIDLRSLMQATEVSEVCWMDIEKIRLVDGPTRLLEKTVAPVFRYVKRYNRHGSTLL